MIAVPKEMQSAIDQAVEVATRPWRDASEKLRTTIQSLKLAIIALLVMQALTLLGLVGLTALLVTSS